MEWSDRSPAPLGHDARLMPALLIAFPAISIADRLVLFRTKHTLA
jgi:hypothetical protein